MAIIATDSGGGGDFSPAPAGNHVAICNTVVDLGKQRVQSQMYGDSIKHQIYLRWELPHEELTWTDKEGREQTGPRVIGKTYTLSLHENANLRADLESWRGRGFTDEERAGFDVAKLLGAPCMLNVIHEAKGPKTYANVKSVAPLPKGTEKPTSKIGLLLYDGDHDGNFEKLPEWLQKKINDQVRDETTVYSGAADSYDDLNDDIPF
jgi:hypothetical protein